MREKIRFPLLEWIKQKHHVLGQFKDTDLELYLDFENSPLIFEIIEENSDKFSRILFEILSGRYNEHLYRKEVVSAVAQNVTAMKFAKGKLENRKQLNIRIYCKEYFKEKDHQQNKRIVMAEVIEHKNTDMDKKLRTFINKIGTYEYDFSDIETGNGNKT